jgi:cytochrome c biogenesis protein CcmG, thiol:disulfide interchange protein DsbE
MMLTKLLLFLLCIFAVFSLYAQKQIPDFTLQDVNGNDVNISEILKTGPAVIDFWATWCQPCLRELPRFDDLQKKYPQVSFLMITIDAPKSKARAKSEVKSKKYVFTTLFDSNQYVKDKLNVDSIPHTFIVKQNGEISYEHLGYNVGDEKVIEDELLKVISPVQQDSLR